LKDGWKERGWMEGRTEGKRMNRVKDGWRESRKEGGKGQMERGPDEGRNVRSEIG
jgi:hypothetical protein